MKSICSGSFICNLGCCLFSVSLIRSACYLSDTLIPGPQHPECGATSSQAFVNAKLFKAKTIKREALFLDLAFVEQCCQKSCILSELALCNGFSVVLPWRQGSRYDQVQVMFVFSSPVHTQRLQSWITSELQGPYPHSPPHPRVRDLHGIVFCLISIEAGASE